MPRAIPPLDLVARALAGLGHARAALELLRLLVARGGEEGARAEPLIAALEARTDALLGAPALRLDVELIESLATHARLREALVVARAVDATPATGLGSSGLGSSALGSSALGSTVLGLEMLHALETVLAPLSSAEPPDLEACYRDALDGSAVAAQRLALSAHASQDLRRRGHLLVQLLRGFRAMSGTPAAPEGLSVEPAVVAVVAEMIQRRDLVWGQRALAALHDVAGGPELRDAVEALVSATNVLVADDAPPPSAMTAPMEAYGAILLQVRMLNLDTAERGLRRLCAERPEDRLAPRLLEAIARVRAVQDASLDEPRAGQPQASPRGAPPEWLNKRARKASVEGWAGSRRAPTPMTEEPPATSVLRPDDEAELHLRAGRPDKAIELYRRLAERFPDRPRFRERAEEIERQMSERALMFADEMTIRRDLTGLVARARPTAVPPVPTSAPNEPASDAERPNEAATRPRRHDATVEMAMQFSDEHAVPEEATDSAVLVPELVAAVSEGASVVTVRPIIEIG